MWKIFTETFEDSKGFFSIGGVFVDVIKFNCINIANFSLFHTFLWGTRNMQSP